MHDTNKHLLYLRECAVSHDHEEAIKYIDVATKNIDSSYKRFNTGFLVVDALVSNAYNTAVSGNIRFKTDIKINKDKITVERYDLSVALGNLLDNAVEACLKIGSNDDRFIDVNISNDERALIINIVNSAPERSQNSSFKTDKSDKIRHGYGLGNVEWIAEKYGGSFTAEQTGGKFEAIVILPL